MSISLKDSQIISEMTEILNSFLPGKPHPYADQSISFPGVAQKLGIPQFWGIGSKKPAITQLLENTLQYQRDKFCELIIEIVRGGIKYRGKKGEPVNREEIQTLNNLILRVEFKIPELWDNSFLDSLPSKSNERPDIEKMKEIKDTSEIKKDYFQLDRMDDEQKRGFSFEKFLNKLFDLFQLKPRSSFRLKGEQIDGSFEINSEFYLLEAKWQKKQIISSELRAFKGCVESKSTWTRGLFVSHSGFSNDSLEAFSKGSSTNIIGMDGQDLYFILEGELSLIEAIHQKSRHAAETGEFFIPIFKLTRK
ncbi:MAG: hypothetical protein C4527_11025 [Candidatus Omnitrophota bacterium]|jgi:hypothetical protein|nr:MAG: hypothetical protein C4527_11025 [Candidatus Omnitrophota bacterium]